MEVGIRFDLRAPGAHGAPQRYAAALDMAARCDTAGIDYVQVSEHHHAEDGYCPSPCVLMAALAARTDHARLRIGALVLSLHDPLRVAEDLAVLDLVSGGRLEAVLGAGYRAVEFKMLARDHVGRGRALEEGVALLRQAWTGEPFSAGGRPALVRPRPAQDPLPLLLAGSSPASARRAARLSMAYLPTDAALYGPYLEECLRLGVPPGPCKKAGPHFLMVSQDPERSWHEVGEHLCHDSNAYAAWLLEEGLHDAKFAAIRHWRELRSSGRYVICTPQECLAVAAGLGPDGSLAIHPLAGGIPPAVAWPAVELFCEAVLPELERAAGGS